ncbi:MAG: hypothetical protein ACUVRS_02520 [Armatimonadota bacterium]
MGKVNVTTIDITGSKEQNAVLPEGVTISRIIDKLVEVLYLPVVNTAGAPISYKLLHKEKEVEVEFPCEMMTSLWPRKCGSCENLDRLIRDLNIAELCCPEC